MGMKRVKRYAYIAEEIAERILAPTLTEEEKLSASYLGLIIADKNFKSRKTKKGFESWARMKCNYEIREEVRKKWRYDGRHISLEVIDEIGHEDECLRQYNERFGEEE